jgi:hypothetical protein
MKSRCSTDIGLQALTVFNPAELPTRCVRFQVLTVASMKCRVFWDVAPCSLIGVDRRFRRAYCLHYQGVSNLFSATMSRPVLTSIITGFFFLEWPRKLQEPCYDSCLWPEFEFGAYSVSRGTGLRDRSMWLEILEYPADGWTLRCKATFHLNWWRSRREGKRRRNSYLQAVWSKTGFQLMSIVSTQGHTMGQVISHISWVQNPHSFCFSDSLSSISFDFSLCLSLHLWSCDVKVWKEIWNAECLGSVGWG